VKRAVVSGALESNSIGAVVTVALRGAAVAGSKCGAEVVRGSIVDARDVDADGVPRC